MARATAIMGRPRTVLRHFAAPRRGLSSVRVKVSRSSARLSHAPRHEGMTRPRPTCAAALLLLVPLLALADDEPKREVTLDEVVIESPKVESTDATLGSTGPDKADLAARKATTGDAADLLRGVPGVSLGGAGGISSLPAIHGLSDDRLRIQVDGTDLMAACPNHMNSPLSYADPSRIESVTVYSGITPVSVGGDSIGGSIQVKSAPPRVRHPRRAVPRRRARRLVLPQQRQCPRLQPRGDPGGGVGEPDHRAVRLAVGELQGRRELQARRARHGRGRTHPGQRGRLLGLPRHHPAVARAGAADRRGTSLQLEAGPADGRVRGVPEPAHGHDLQRQLAGLAALHRYVRLGRPRGAPQLPGHEARDGHGAGPLLLRYRHADGHGGDGRGGRSSRRT